MSRKIDALCFMAVLAITTPASGQEESTNRLTSETLIDAQWPLLSIMKFIDSTGNVRSSPGPDTKWAVGAGPELTALSPDGKRVAYRRHEKKKAWVVCNGKEEQTYDGVDERFITFSPDSKRLAYFAKTGKNWMLVVDGKEATQYKNANGLSLIFSPDSQHLAYVAEVGKKRAVVVDEREVGQYDSAGQLLFSPDGKYFLYAASLGEHAFVVLDGVAETAYDEVGSSIFSPDGEHVAYVAKSGKSSFVVLDGKEQKRYASIDPHLLFSPDSGHLAYWANSGAAWNNAGSWFFVLDGKEEKDHFDVSAWRVTFESFGITEQVLSAANSRYNMVLSPDGKHVAHVVEKATQTRVRELVVFDGAKQPLYDEIDDRSLAFSPDGSHLVYTARLGKKWFVVFDGKEGKQYEGALPVTFSQDSKHSAYPAIVGDFDLVMVIDGREGGRMFDRIPGSGRFDPPDTFRYLATKPTDVKVQSGPGGYLPGLFLVEEKIK